MPAPTPRVAPWEDLVLRLIAIWKLLHAVFFTAVGFGLIRLRGHNVVEFLTTHVVIPYHLDPEGRWVDWMLDKAGMLTSHRLLLLGWAAFFYAALFAAEGVGLYLRKHWAEYLVVIVTGSLLPLELYELFVKLAWWKFGVVMGNLAIVTYLIHRLRLDYHNRLLQGATPSAPAQDTKSSGDNEGPPSVTSAPVTTEAR